MENQNAKHYPLPSILQCGKDQTGAHIRLFFFAGKSSFNAMSKSHGHGTCINLICADQLSHTLIPAGGGEHRSVHTTSAFTATRRGTQTFF